MQAEKLQQLAKQRLLEEKQLAAELERHTWESEKQSKEIQLLANRSDEIRKLREQLRIAEVIRFLLVCFATCWFWGDEWSQTHKLCR